MSSTIEYLIDLSVKDNIRNGEDLFFLVRSILDIDVKIRVFSIQRRKYIYYDFDEGSWAESTNETYTSYIFPSNYILTSDAKYLALRIPQQFFAKPDFIEIKVEDISNNENYIVKTVIYGEAVNLEADKINVYGQVFDFEGRPMPNELIVFYAVNETTYYDNPVHTNMNVVTTTDSNGRFSVFLNRNYNYVVTVSKMPFSKIAKLKEVNRSVSSVKLCIGATTC